MNVMWNRREVLAMPAAAQASRAQHPVRLPIPVQWALRRPIMPSIFVGGTPVPVQAPPAVALDDVTNG